MAARSSLFPAVQRFRAWGCRIPSAGPDTVVGAMANKLNPHPEIPLDSPTGERIAAAIEGTADSADVGSHVFAQYAHQPGNDPVALAAIMRRPRQRFTHELLAGATCQTLVAIGDKDFAGPGEPLAEALPNATLKTLRGVDHFATPEAFGFIDAALEFLDAIPA